MTVDRDCLPVLKKQNMANQDRDTVTGWEVALMKILEAEKKM